MARHPIYALLFAVGILLLGCGDSDSPSGTIATRPASMTLSIAPGVESTAWNFLSTTVRDEDGTSVYQLCEAYTGFGLPIELEIPAKGRVEVEVHLLSGNGVCDAGGGGFLVARGVSTPNPLGTDLPENPQLLVQARLVDGFTPTFGISGEATYPTETRYGAAHYALPNGYILVVGGATLKAPLLVESEPFSWENPESLGELRSSMEMYDPNTGAWIPLPKTSGLQEPDGTNSANWSSAGTECLGSRGRSQASSSGEIIPSAAITLIDLETLVPYPAEQEFHFSSRIRDRDTNRFRGNLLLFLTGGIENPPAHMGHTPRSTGAPQEEHILGFGNLHGALEYTATHLTSRAGVEQIYLVGGEETDKHHRLIDALMSRENGFSIPREPML